MSENTEKVRSLLAILNATDPKSRDARAKVNDDIWNTLSKIDTDTAGYKREIREVALLLEVRDGEALVDAAQRTKLALIETEKAGEDIRKKNEQLLERVATLTQALNEIRLTTKDSMTGVIAIRALADSSSSQPGPEAERPDAKLRAAGIDPEVAARWSAKVAAAQPGPETCGAVCPDTEFRCERAKGHGARDHKFQSVTWPVSEDATERFERLAEEFRRKTGMLAPGKDAPAAGPGHSHEERHAAWEQFIRERS